MHAREIILILFIILMILFGVKSYMSTHAPMQVPMQAPMRTPEYPSIGDHITSSDSLGIDPVTYANTQVNKQAHAPAYVPMHEPTYEPMSQRKKKSVSFAPQKEVAVYSKQDGNIRGVVAARV